MRKILQKIRYPKFLLFILTFVAAYILFSGRSFLPLHNFLFSLEYFGTFLAGIFFVYGFTAAPATAILLILAKSQNIVLAGFIAGMGALLGDLIIFKLIRHSFADELEKLRKEKVVSYLGDKTPDLLKRYLMPIFVGFIIASPLPDEIGISLLATSKTISMRIFSIIAYLFNTVGIFIILVIGNLI